METKFNFNSSVCTSKVQSERLLALGLKKETADCGLVYKTHELDGSEIEPEFLGMTDKLWENDVRQTVLLSKQKQIPAWSLHRLIEMTSDFCDVDGEEGVWCCESRVILGYRSVMTEEWLIMWNKPSLYDNIIDCIGWLIKEGYFNKEYLV